MSRHRKKSGVPDRWEDYKAVGRRLDGTRFVAFKVPLKQSLSRQLPSSEAFGHWQLLDALSEEKQELGLVIDLTFTTRYYSLQDVPESLLVVKILTAGHAVPSDRTILSFKRAVRRFLRDNADNDKLIGVHCTHGLNRTGYLICRYLIDVDGMDPEAAVELFNLARGHAIERQNYLDDLQHGPKRSNEGMDECEQEPMRGRAARRPDSREERRPHFGDSWYLRSGTDHRSHPYRPLNGLLPSPPLLPPPPYCPPMGAHVHHPYRWPPSHPDGQWRRPPRSEDSRSGYPPAEPDWSLASHWQEDRRRAPRPPPPIPCYSPRWTNESSGRDAPEEDWDRHGMRHRNRFTERERPRW
uniref:RNA/RNP complex-1-interacting phosphatase n=1 Tax=Scatophagus argus TaxID=75038 RepID=UPI001ED7D6C4|nr:RNA/RNP complex-1-interacting phosphatase [Scatophagus argus]